MQHILKSLLPLVLDLLGSKINEEILLSMKIDREYVKYVDTNELNNEELMVTTDELSTQFKQDHLVAEAGIVAF